MAALLLALALSLAQDEAGPDAIAPGKARIVFYRTGGFYFSGRGCELFERSGARTSRIGTLGGGRYLVREVDPGDHVLAASQGIKKPVRVRLTPGATAYVRCLLSGFPGRVKLYRSHVDEFDRHADALKRAD